MQKGKWLFNLTLLALKGKITLTEALTWGIGRIKHKPLSLSLCGISFEQVDRTFWGIVTDVFLNQVYTPSGFEINHNDIVMDIGAHRGAFTAYAAIKGAGKIVAYEPNPDNFVYLEKLIIKNSFKNVIINQYGIGAKTGRVLLYLSPINSRHSIIIPPEETHKENNKDSAITINVLSLTDCINNFDQIDFLKMDCEDAEREILLNTSNGVISKVKKMSVEIHKPADSNEIKLLINHLKNTYHYIKIVQSRKSQYGYIYAR